MKILGRKILIFSTTALLAVFLSFRPVLAKSGCCSSHGGVCCECGAQTNGKVICNDGWRGSSCYYSEMVMCGGSSNSSSNYIAPTSPPPSPEPTATPVIIIATPTPKPTSTPIPKLTATPTPTHTPTPTSEPTNTPAPKVKGMTDEREKQEELTTTEALGSLGTIGALGWGGYKFAKKAIGKLRKLN